MRIAIVSDIHANLVALETVLAVAGAVDTYWNLGDTIGYGPRPNECLALMLPQAGVMIAGNHDLASLGAIDLTDFNADAKTANLWNGAQLQPEQRAALLNLPPMQAVDERFLVAHGSPREPVWEYLLSREQARENFPLFTQQVCFIGHSHVPLVMVRNADGTLEGPEIGRDGMVIALDAPRRFFINPGSVGQPRDHDPRAAYAILDTDANTLTFHRIEYDIAATQRQMREAKLPRALIQRLEFGM